MEYRSQHWIPHRSYSLAWADPEVPNNKRIHLFSPDKGYLKWQRPKGVFCADDLYTITRPTGERDVRVEQYLLGMIDRDFSVAQKRLVAKNQLTNRDRRSVLAFVAAMHQRSPEMRDHHKAALDSVVEVGDGMKLALERALPERRAAMLKASANSLSKGATSATLDEFRVLANANFGELLPRRIAIERKILEQMTICIMHTSASLGFITSDAPVVWWVDDGSGRCVRGPFGLGHKLIEVTMPIAPSACVYISHRQMPEHLDVSDQSVSTINSRTLHGCKEILIANTDKMEIMLHG